MGSIFIAIVRRDLLLALRQKGEIANALLFFVVVAAIVPFGVGADPNQLRSIGPGIIWVAALLASLLALGRLFQSDAADGTLEQLMLSPQPFVLVAGAKMFAHWVATGLPTLAVAPVLALMYGLPADATLVLLAGLALGTPVLSLIGGIGAALTLGARGGGALLALLVLPLYVPILVFGAGAVDAVSAGLDPMAHLVLLGAGLLGSVALAPLAAATALRIAME